MQTCTRVFGPQVCKPTWTTALCNANGGDTDPLVVKPPNVAVVLMATVDEHFHCAALPGQQICFVEGNPLWPGLQRQPSSFTACVGGDGCRRSFLACHAAEGFREKPGHFEVVAKFARFFPFCHGFGTEEQGRNVFSREASWINE